MSNFILGYAVGQANAESNARHEQTHTQVECPKVQTVTVYKDRDPGDIVVLVFGLFLSFVIGVLFQNSRK